MNALEIQKAIDGALLEQSRIAAAIFVEPENRRTYQCSVVGCSRSAYAKSLCNAHYIRKRKGMPLDIPVRARKRDDVCAKCGKQTGAKGGWGLCAKHYKQSRYTAVKRALVDCFGGRCSRCSGVFPLAAYDFHHLSDKEDAPSSMILNASSRAIAREVSKCILLCSNCHRITHSEQF